MKHTTRLLLPLVLLALTLLPGAAQAGFAPENEPIFSAEQTSSPDIAIDAAGNSIVAWSDERKLGDPREPKARRLSATGTLGPTLELDPGQIGSDPAVGISAAGRAFVAWEARASESDPDSVEGRWIEPNGAMGPVLTLLEGKAGLVDAAYVRVVVDPSGVATVTWQNSDDSNAIGLRRVQPNGTLGTPIADISGSTAPEHETVALPNGSTVAVWRDSGIETNTVDAGGAFGVPVKISSLGLTNNPEIAADALGNSLVVWRASSGAEYAPYGRLLGPTGAPTGAELTIDPPSTEFVNSVSVAADSAADFVVTFDRQYVDNSKRVFVRGLNLDGYLAPNAAGYAWADPASPLAVPILFDNNRGAYAWRAGTGTGTSAFGRELVVTGLSLAPDVPMIFHDGINSIRAASAPPIAMGAFLVHYPISGSAQAAVVRRFMTAPACSDSSAKVVQGKPIAIPIACTGAAIETVQIGLSPVHGTISFDPATLSFTYEPKPGYKGSDRFSYAAVNDGGGSNVVRVTVAVGKDTVKPKVKRLKLIRQGRPGHQRFKFRLAFSEPATVKLTVKKFVGSGRQTKLRKLGALTTKKPARKATLVTRGKLARQLRAGGRFRVVAIATDPAFNSSKAKRLGFRVR